MQRVLVVVLAVLFWIAKIAAAVHAALLRVAHAVRAADEGVALWHLLPPQLHRRMMHAAEALGALGIVKECSDR